jgi:signal transduction histidine kinase
MKLINKINRRYLFYSLIVLIFLCVAINIALKIIIAEETDETLEYNYRQVERLIKEKIQFAMPEPFVSVQLIGHARESRCFSDTMLYYYSDEGEKFRQLTVIKTINNNTYKITVRESTIESGDLLETVIILVFISLLLLFGMLFYLNMRISKSVWLPFYKNLEKLKKFSLHKRVTFCPENSDISEFQELNKTLKSLTEKVINDYDIIKKFAENASHELQTPLAIIRSKIESLLEGNELAPVQAEKIQSVYKSVNRLTKINKDLLLLTKIENQQFVKIEAVSMKKFILEQMEYFSELAGIMEIKIDFRDTADWIINCDKALIEILVNNLFSNAIKHNIKGGAINIELENKKMVISNSGTKNIEDAKHIFDRFYKEAGSDSIGLGLAIAKQICLMLNLKIEYNFSDKIHSFTLYA